MVTVKDYKKRETKSGDEFFVLVLQGAIVPVKSKESGRMYFTAKTATAASTFDEETCKQIIGSQFPEEIVKKELSGSIEKKINDLYKQSVKDKFYLFDCSLKVYKEKYNKRLDDFNIRGTVFYENLGQDLIQQYKRVTISFDNKYLELNK